ncbi:MAG: hypothetical protein ACLTSX_13600 [Collinsella sp.]
MNSEFQKQSGKPTYDPKEIVYHIVGNTANRCDIRQWRVWADRSGELVDTLIEKVLTPAGIPFTCSPAPDEPELWLNRVRSIYQCGARRSHEGQLQGNSLRHARLSGRQRRRHSLQHQGRGARAGTRPGA